MTVTDGTIPADASCHLELPSGGQAALAHRNIHPMQLSHAGRQRIDQREGAKRLPQGQGRARWEEGGIRELCGRREWGRQYWERGNERGGSDVPGKFRSCFGVNPAGLRLCTSPFACPTALFSSLPFLLSPFPSPPLPPSPVPPSHPPTSTSHSPCPLDLLPSIVVRSHAASGSDASWLGLI